MNFLIFQLILHLFFSQDVYANFPPWLYPTAHAQSRLAAATSPHYGLYDYVGRQQQQGSHMIDPMVHWIHVIGSKIIGLK